MLLRSRVGQALIPEDDSLLVTRYGVKRDSKDDLLLILYHNVQAVVSN